MQESELTLPPPPRSAPSGGCAPLPGSSPSNSSSASAPASVAAGAPTMATTPAPAAVTPTPRARSLGSRILHGLSLKSSPCSTASSSSSSSAARGTSSQPSRGASRGSASRGAPLKGPPRERGATAEKENICESNKSLKSSSGKKGHLLSRYFQVHRKICLPLFSRGRLYKAQSCGSLTGPHGHGPHERTYPCYGDANQNVSRGVVVGGSGSCAGMCEIHLRDSTKCCSLC